MAQQNSGTKKALDKCMSLQEAISRFVHDQDKISFGGMGGIQSVAPTYEIIRQGQKELTLIGDSPCECADLFIGTGRLKRVEVAWIAYAIAGISPCYRRAVEKQIPRPIEVVEFSNFTMGMRFLAGAMGIPFMPTKSLRGSSIEEFNDMIKVVDDPYSNRKITLVPAANPDVAIIHANRADRYGNTQFLGFSSNAENIARAAKHTIITCEEIVSVDEIREASFLTSIPQYVVDAVVEVPFGTHPWNMPYAMAYDIPFHMNMMSRIATEEGFNEWIQEWAFGCKNHDDYCAKVGWNRLMKLNRLEKKFCRSRF